MAKTSLIDKYRFVIAGVLIGILGFTFFYTNQFGMTDSVSNVIKNLNKPKDFMLKDKCGPVMNTISHSIPDEAMCENSCRARCITEDLSYKEAMFEQNDQTCNTCECHCK